MTHKAPSAQEQSSEGLGNFTIPTEGNWPVTTVLWSAIALCLPINYALPSATRFVWFITGMVLLCVPALFGRVSRPLYPAIWLFAGYASFVAILTATKIATVNDNLFVGAQLIALLGFGSFTLTHNAMHDPRFILRVSVAFLIGQTASALVAVLQLMGQSIVVSGKIYGSVLGRAAGLAEHPNTLGVMAAVASLLAVHLLFVSRRLRLVVIGMLLVNMLGLVASGSLTGVLALAIGLSVLALSMRRYVGRMILWSGGAAAAFLFVVSLTGVLEYLPSLGERYSQVTGETDSDSSWDARARTYDFAWGSIKENPLPGNGLSSETSGTFNGITTVHNFLLRSWYQGGIFLAIAFAFILLGVLLVVLRAILSGKNSGEASMLVAIIVYASVSPLLEQRHIWLLVLVCWASISSKNRLPSKGNDFIAISPAAKG